MRERSTQNAVRSTQNAVRSTILLMLFILTLSSAGCVTVVEENKTDKPSAFATDTPPPKKVKQNTDQSVKSDPLSGAKMSAAAVSNGTASAAKGIGDGASWFFGELLKPFESLREGFIDTFGVVQKDK